MNTVTHASDRQLTGVVVNFIQMRVTNHSLSFNSKGFWQRCLTKGIHLRVQHQPGKKNIRAD